MAGTSPATTGADQNEGCSRGRLIDAAVRGRSRFMRATSIRLAIGPFALRSALLSPRQEPALHPSVEETLARATNWLLDSQKPEGYWVGMVESNSCIEAQWLLCSHILEASTCRSRRASCARFSTASARTAPGIFFPTRQPATSIPPSKSMRRCARWASRRSARKWRGRGPGFMRHGGLTNVRVFTRYWLALIGIWPWTRHSQPAARDHPLSPVVSFQHL